MDRSTGWLKHRFGRGSCQLLRAETGLVHTVSYLPIRTEHRSCQLTYRLADSKEIALVVPEPGGLLANAPLARVVPGDLGDAVDRPQAREVVFLEHHSTRSQPLHGRLDVFDLPPHLGVIS